MIIRYGTYLNLMTISFADGSYTDNVYSATGEKLKSTHVTMLNGTISAKTTMEYRGNVIYKNGKVDMVLIPGGYAAPYGSGFMFHYYAQDYLGNNRAVINGYDGNRLVSVSDAVIAPSYNGFFGFSDGIDNVVEYEYDANGNMTRDWNKGISSITYNVGNLPLRIQYGNGSRATYLYAADGTKLQVRYVTSYAGLLSSGSQGGSVSTAIAQTHTIDYDGNRIYEDGKLNKILVDGGYVDYNGGKPVYNAYLTDHQGNIRMVVSESAAVRQVVNYYPYGALMAENTRVDVQRYMYNGKELDRMHGLDWYDYGARHYDAAIGRWHSMDDMCHAYYDISPYAYCGGDPVNAIDPDGNIIIFVNGMHFGDGGTPKYWNGVDYAIANTLKDNRTLYLDGSFGGIYNLISSGFLYNNYLMKNRIKVGYDTGNKYAEYIYGNLLKNETIKIISHSMGATFAKGLLEALLQFANENNLEHRIAVEIDLAPYQANEQKGNDHVPTFTISHGYDRLAKLSFMRNAKNFHTRMDATDSNTKTEHGIDSFREEVIKLIREGKIETSVKY